MKKIFSMIFVSLLFLSGMAYAGGKVEVIYFYGEECPHCHELQPWLKGFLARNPDVQLNKYEFWHNSKNATMFASYMATYGVPEEEQGAPTIIVNNKTLIGSKEIVDNLAKEVIAARNNLAVAEAMTKAEKKKPDALSITVTALADSVNPCAMMVLIILLSSLTVIQKSKARIAATAISFIAAAYITYLGIGMGLTHVVTVSGVDKWIVTAVGGIAIIIGLMELKDTFFYRVGNWAVEIPEAWRESLNKLILSVTGPVGAFFTGVAVTFFELPCTGGPYIFGISLISQVSETERILWLMYYNMIFIAPLIFIAAAVLAGSTTIEKAEELRNKHIKTMHFIIGVIMLGLGIWALFFR